MTIATRPEELSDTAFLVKGIDQLQGVTACKDCKGPDKNADCFEQNPKSRDTNSSPKYHANNRMVYAAGAISLLSLALCFVLTILLYQYRVELDVTSRQVNRVIEKLHVQCREDMAKLRISLRSEVSELVRDITKQYLKEEDSHGVSDILEIVAQARSIDLGDSVDTSADEMESDPEGDVDVIGNRMRRDIEQEGSPAGARHHRRHNRRKRNRHCTGCLKAGAITIEHLHGNRSVSQGTDYGGASPFSEDIYKNWNHASWSTGESQFDRKSGLLTIKESGVYFVYVQVMFVNAFLGANGFDVIVTRTSPEGETNIVEPILSCKQSVDYYNTSRSEAQNIKYKTCFSARPAELRANDTLAVKSKYAGRKVLFTESTSFWGVVKLPPKVIVG